MDDLDIEAQRRIAAFVKGFEAMLHQVLRQQRKPLPRSATEDLARRQDQAGPSDAGWVEPDLDELAVPQAREVLAALAEHLKGNSAPIKTWLGLTHGRAGRPSPSRREKALEILEFRRLMAGGADRYRAAEGVGRDQTTLSRWLRQDQELRDLVEAVEKLDERASAVTRDEERVPGAKPPESPAN
jgi:hypothetical protein